MSDSIILTLRGQNSQLYQTIMANCPSHWRRGREFNTFDFVEMEFDKVERVESVSEILNQYHDIIFFSSIIPHLSLLELEAVNPSGEGSATRVLLLQSSRSSIRQWCEVQADEIL